LPNSILEIKNYNNDFLILKSKNQSFLTEIGKSVFMERLDFIDEVIVTPIEICLKLNENFEESKIEQLQKVEQKVIIKFKTYKLPVYFNEHEDWENVKSQTSFSKKEIIEKLITCNYSISMFGFLPGFIYMEGLDPSLYVSRKTIPSKYVKANSLALGGKYVGLYSIDSPGGWYVIGQIPVSILEIPQLPPVAMNLGDQIVLHPIDKIEFEYILQKQISLKEYNG
jgi:KipI family sensor histidine kinase inhibitor